MPGPMLEPRGPTSVTSDSVPAIPGFSSAVKVGLSLHLSGQVALDSAARVVGPGDLRAQTRQSLGNVIRLVRAARGLPGDVVKLTFHVVGLDSVRTRTIQEVAGEVFTEQPAPAVTVVGVAALPEPGLLVSVDGLAILRGEFPDRERQGAQ
jgi:enamine deaminase RidA (YjgF/YER057c/UK114 family)